MQWRLQQILPALWCAFLSAALYFSGLFVLFTPLPLLYLSLRRNRLQWGIGFALALLFVVCFYKFLTPAFFPAGEEVPFREFGLFQAFYYLWIAFLLSLGVWKQWSLARWGLFLGLGGATGVLVGGLFVQSLGIFDVGVFLEHIVAESQAVLDQTAAGQAAKGDRAEMVAIAARMKKSVEYFPRLIPALVFSFSLFVMVLNIGFLRITCRISKHAVKAGDFRRLQLSLSCIWVVIAAAGLYFFDFYALKASWPVWAALNLLMAAGVGYFIQGVSIMAFFLKRYSPLFRFGIYGLVVLFFQMVGLVVVGLGLADTWFDFRKLHKPAAKA